MSRPPVVELSARRKAGSLTTRPTDRQRSGKTGGRSARDDTKEVADGRVRPGRPVRYPGSTICGTARAIFLPSLITVDPVKTATAPACTWVPSTWSSETTAPCAS